jgi:hypothetical protein
MTVKLYSSTYEQRWGYKPIWAFPTIRSKHKPITPYIFRGVVYKPYDNI